MQLLKPIWVNHDEDKAIFSVDIHPDGSRFATGGQGQDSSGRVVIWKLQPVVSEKSEEDNVPKLLCQLDQHLGCVNCVRWSNSGKFLASAGDDKVIIIWQLSFYGGGAVFGSNVINVESWRIVSSLRGHNGDILDVAWSPGDIWLASASVDNTVIVWNVSKWPEQIRVLKGHTGLVKGVTWDPVGRYLASQADDKSLRIWRTSNWSVENIITDPFEECGGTTTVLRPSWSPDGQYLVSAHAMNNGGPTAQIIERDGWNTDKDFVGHRKAITCVRFSPNILKKQDVNMTKPVQYCCVAIGSRDRSISIWFTSLKRPLVVIHDVFEDSVLDLSWSKCGQYLMAVSKDGSLAFIHFTTEEIGKLLTLEETSSCHVKLYGSSALTSAPSTNIIENPELLKLKGNEKNPCKQAGDNLIEEKRKVHLAPINKQIEMRTADGRRRITPMFIPPPVDGEVSISMDTNFSPSRQEKSKIIIEKVDGIFEPNVSSPVKSATIAATTSTSSTTTAPISEINGVPAGLSSRIEAPTTVTLIPGKPVCLKRKINEPIGAIMAKRKRGRARLIQTHIDTQESHLIPSHPPSPIPNVIQSIPERFSLPVAKISQTTRIQIPDVETVEGVAPLLVIENDWLNGESANTNGTSLHKVSRLDSGGTVWSAYMPTKILSAAVAKFCVAIACENSSFHLLSPSVGEYILPPIQLHGKPSQMFIQNSCLVVLTADAHLFIWNFELKKRIMLESIRHLVENKSSIQSIQLVGCDSKSFPAVILKNGQTFSWCRELEAWVQLGESVGVRRYINSKYTTIDACHETNQHNTLTSILMQSTTYCGSTSLAQSTALSDNVRQGLTESFLKRMITSAKYVNSSADYKFWLKRLVNFYINETMENELRKIFDDLLSPTLNSLSGQLGDCSTKFLGLDTKQLLEEFLKQILLAENSLRLQRLHAEYQEQLNGTFCEDAI